MRRRAAFVLALCLTLSLAPMPLPARAAATYVSARPPARLVSYARSMAKQHVVVWYPSRLPRGSVVESVRVFQVKRSQTTSAGVVCIVSVKNGSQRVWVWNGPRQTVMGLSRATIAWGPYQARVYQQTAALRWTLHSSHSVRVSTSLTQLKVIAASMRAVK